MVHAVGLGGRETVRGTAASVPRVPTDVCRDFAVVGTAELVLSGGAAGGGGSLAAPGHVLRRTAEVMRSWMGHQERWLLWHSPASPRGERCTLSASTVHRWLMVRGSGRRRACWGNLEGIGETQSWYGWAVGQAEGAGRAGGAHSRGQRQWPDLSACGGTERGARGRMGRFAGTRPSRGLTCRSCAVSARWGQRAPGVLTECARRGWNRSAAGGS